MLITQSCSTLRESVGSQSPPGSSVPGVSRQEDWSGLPCPPPVDLPDPGIEAASPALQTDSLPLEPAEKAHRQGWNNWKSPTFLRSLRELKKQGKLRPPNQERQMKLGHHSQDKLTQKRGCWVMKGGNSFIIIFLWIVGDCVWIREWEIPGGCNFRGVLNSLVVLTSRNPSRFAHF